MTALIYKNGFHYFYWLDGNLVVREREGGPGELNISKESQSISLNRLEGRSGPSGRGTGRGQRTFSLGN